MDQLLKTPELLSAIFERLCAQDVSDCLQELSATFPDVLFHEKLPHSGRTVARCLSVSKLWLETGIRYAWRLCDVKERRRPGYLQTGWNPSVYELTNVGPTLERVQLYAKHIESLYIGPAAMLAMEDEHEYEPLDDQTDRHHNLLWSLPDIEFPRLRKLVYMPNPILEGQLPSDGWQVSKLLHPDLAEFVFQGFELPQGLLFCLKAQRDCFQLKSLSLGWISAKSSAEASEFIASHMESWPALRSFAHHPESPGWNANNLIAMAKHPSLNAFKTGLLPDEWIFQLGKASQNLFPSIQELSASLSDQGLGALAPYMDGLRTLKVCMMGGSRRALKEIASITSLGTLVLSFAEHTQDRSTIRGDDLIVLAQFCPSLLHIEIGQYVKFQPEPYLKAINLTDATVSAVGKLLPKLRVFSLLMHSSQLTENSILSLGERCKLLKVCRISSTIDLQSLTLHGKEAMFASLEHFVNYNEWAEPPESSNMREMLGRLSFMLPNVKFYHLGPGHYVPGRENVLNKAFGEALERADLQKSKHRSRK